MCLCVCVRRNAKKGKHQRTQKEAMKTQKTLSHLVSCACVFVCVWAINKPHTHSHGAALWSAKKRRQRQNNQQMLPATTRWRAGHRPKSVRVCVRARVCVCKWKADVESSAQLTGPSTGLHQQWQQRQRQRQQEQQPQKSMLRLGAEIKCDLFAWLRTETELQDEKQRKRGWDERERDSWGGY